MSKEVSNHDPDSDIKHRFLRLVEDIGFTDIVMRELHITTTQFEKWKLSPLFRDELNKSLLLHSSRVEATALQRFIDGIKKPVYFKGQLCYKRDPEGNLIYDPLTLDCEILYEVSHDNNFIEKFLKSRNPHFGNDKNSMLKPDDNKADMKPLGFTINFKEK